MESFFNWIKTIWKLKTKIIIFCNLRFIRFCGIVALVVFVVYLVPSNEPKYIDLLAKPDSLFLYINSNYPEKRASLFLNQMLGTALNLGWYDVCFSSKEGLYKNKGLVDNTQIGINILPLNSNQSIGAIGQWVKELLFYEPDSPVAQEQLDQLLPKFTLYGPDGLQITDNDSATQGVLDKLVQTTIFSSPDGSRSCTPISLNEKGFFYDGNIYLLEQTLDKTVPNKYLNKVVSLSMKDDDPIHLLSATLEIRTNGYALYAKRVALFLLFIGLIASIWKILLFVFRGKRK